MANALSKAAPKKVAQKKVAQKKVVQKKRVVKKGVGRKNTGQSKTGKQASEDVIILKNVWKIFGMAAAMLVLEVQHIAKSTDNAAVATVGALTVLPNSRNTIPGLVSFTVDMRHQDDNLLLVMDRRLRQACEDIDDAKIDLEMIWHNPLVIFDKQAISAIRGATRELKYAHREMVSGAGHDACQIARKVPTAMVFVPCKDGLSHNQAESAKPSDLEAGCNVLLHAALRLSN